MGPGASGRKVKRVGPDGKDTVIKVQGIAQKAVPGRDGSR